MGSSEGKLRIEQLEKRQEAMMKEHADMVQRLADEQEKSRRQHEAAIEQMAKLMLVMIAANNQATGTKQEKTQLEIEGVNYIVVEQLGEGGFGKIYKAQVKGSDRFVAIKAMRNSPVMQKEIENEIRFIRTIKKVRVSPHPVVEYYGCAVTSDLVFIAMELAQCDILKFWFGGMSDRSAEEKFTFGIIIMMYTLRALTFLEKLNIIHGDIKPQNLVLVQMADSITIKLIDFGTIEKMNTMRSVLTVDPGKAHTQFFASPEFLQRDANRLIARRLHKKSDAWAAGVMFYVLFLEKFPWADEHEYENFINDPRARDIVVPADGGYKLIIELLLKKDPDARASAKDTLLQMKGHPKLGVIVKALEETLHPCDDVCHLRIPDHLREELGRREEIRSIHFFCLSLSLASCVTGTRRAHMLDTSSSSSGATATATSTRSDTS